MIKEDGEQIVAPFGRSEEKLRQIAHTGITRMGMRRLQPFLVTLYRQEIDALRKAGAIVPIAEGPATYGVWRPSSGTFTIDALALVGRPRWRLIQRVL